MNTPATIESAIPLTFTPAVIEFDFEAAKATLQDEVAKYDVVVTEETLADSKKLATQLNKTAAAIDDLRKKVVAEASAPVKVADGQLKELVQLYKDGRQKITDQVQQFEDKVKAIAEKLLKDLRDAQWDQQGVAAEFRDAQYGDLVKLGALTKKQQLTSATANELIQRVQVDKANQDRVKMRLMQLENASLKAGLSAPLTREHVSHFLFQDDDSYETQLQAVITRELDRQQQAEEALRQKIQREEQAKAEAAALAEAAAPVGQSAILQKAANQAPAMAPPPSFGSPAAVTTYGALPNPSAAAEAESMQEAKATALAASQHSPFPLGVWADGELESIMHQGAEYRRV